MKFLATEGAPKAIGPYSQAVVDGGWLYASGQIPLDPKTGELVGGGIEKSAERIFDNLEAVLASAGLTSGNGLPHRDPASAGDIQSIVWHDRH